MTAKVNGVLVIIPGRASKTALYISACRLLVKTGRGVLPPISQCEFRVVSR